LAERVIAATVLVEGAAEGSCLASDVPISIWGGLNPETGEVIDRHHPLSGATLTGKWLVVPHGRGSCSASGVLLEAIANGTGPCGIVVSQVDPILGFGAILADEICGLRVPVVLVSEVDRANISRESRLVFDGATLRVTGPD
jgi:predicted aconitase with swiveling domain